MNKNFFVGIAGAVSVMVSPALLADTSARLFQDWYYGQHINEFPPSQGYYDCSDNDLVVSLCHDDITFLQRSFMSRFQFDEDGRLVTTMIASEYSQDLYVTLVGALSRNFAFIYLEGDSDSFDLVEHAQQDTFSDQTSMMAAVAEFEAEQLSTGYLGISFVEQGFLADSQSFSNTNELLLNMPTGVRAVDINIVEDEVEAFLAATFYLPGQQLKSVRQKAHEAPIEDF
jgi:hypothetical protein